MGHFRFTPILFAIFFLFALEVTAQVGGYGIPATYEVGSENVLSGDVISFRPDLNQYVLSQIPEDENMFGVINENPVVVFRSGANRFPIVQIGEVNVNVSDLNGPISVGDVISSSIVPGKAARLGDKREGFILGYALEPFVGAGTSTSAALVGEREVKIGSIRVLLSIGPLDLNDQQNEETLSPATIFVREDSGETETGLETIFRYVTAVLFTLGTVFVVLKTFGPNIGKGVVSIGRNPLAKTSIQAMVVFNIILIISIIAVSFIISLLIIFLPI